MKGYSAFYNFIYRFIPTRVSDRVVLAALSLCSLSGLSGKTITAHLAENTDGFTAYRNRHGEDSYIEHQEDMKGLLAYGTHGADYNACEVIAVYNTLLFFSDGSMTASFPKLLAAFERRGICLKGRFGTSPNAICRYLKTSGYAVAALRGERAVRQGVSTLEREYRAFILTAYNDRTNVGAAIHTVSITPVTVDGTVLYEMHNAGGQKRFRTLSEAVTGYRGGAGKAILLIGVNDRHKTASL